MAKNPSPREEKEGEREEKRGAPGKGGVLRLGFWLAQRGEERGEGVFMVPTQGSKIPLDSN